MDITVSLSAAETKAFAFVAADPQEWVQNVVRERARIAMEQIFQRELPTIMASGDASVLAGGIDAVVLAADLSPASSEEIPAPPA